MIIVVFFCHLFIFINIIVIYISRDLSSPTKGSPGLLYQDCHQVSSVQRDVRVPVADKKGPPTRQDQTRPLRLSVLLPFVWTKRDCPTSLSWAWSKYRVLWSFREIAGLNECLRLSLDEGFDKPLLKTTSGCLSSNWGLGGISIFCTFLHNPRPQPSVQTIKKRTVF